MGFDITSFLMGMRSGSGSGSTPRQMTVAKVQIVAAQAGSGDPSPDNTSLISGYTSCDVWVSPTQDPADGTTYQIAIPSTPGTVYGGELDLETGVQTVDMGLVLCSVSASNITVGTTNAGYHWAEIKFATLGIGVALIGHSRVKSSNYLYVPNGVDAKYGYVRLYTDRFRFYDDRFTSASAAKAVLDNVQVLYPLDTILTYQLTAQSITAMTNQYVGANCGPVLLKFA